MESANWQPLVVALGLGLLVGLQREWAKSEGAGIRTFALITVLGTVCGLLAARSGGWIVAAGLLGVAALLVNMNLHRSGSAKPHRGQTTEVAALLMFATGALLAFGETAIAITVGGGVAVLLQWKAPLHGFVERIGQAEIRAVFRLVLIALVVLPLLPNQAYGPYGVLNPFQLWLMVVLIVGISVSGYLASRYLDSGRGALLGGVLGGIISSTATTISYARQSRRTPAFASLGAVIILVASTVVFLRVAVEVAVVAPSVLPQVAPQLAVMAIWMLVIAVGSYKLASQEQPPVERLSVDDPSELAPAVVFGALYALVLFAVAAVQDSFGDRGLYVVAALSGLTDIDAITLSTAQLMDAGGLDIDTGWRMMLVGAMSNIIFKTAVVASLGTKALLSRISAGFGLALGGGVVLLWLWPG